MFYIATDKSVTAEFIKYIDTDAFKITIYKKLNFIPSPIYPDIKGHLLCMD